MVSVTRVFLAEGLKINCMETKFIRLDNILKDGMMVGRDEIEELKE